ncbi:MAG: ABC transporter ATP-binding protein [Alphaproteobacteria bacterium]
MFMNPLAPLWRLVADARADRREAPRAPTPTVVWYRPSTWVDITAMPSHTMPPRSLGAFVRYFVAQLKTVLLLAFVLEALIAATSAFIPYLIGQLVDGMSTSTNAQTTLNQLYPLLFWGGLLVVLGRPLLVVALHAVYSFAYTPVFGNLIRRQLHGYTLQHSMSYFQNDYAGRVANKVLESGPALREAVMGSVTAVWYAGFFTISAFVLLAKTNLLLAIPAVLWLIGYAILLRHFVPQVQQVSAAHSEVHSTLVGRIVDSYTNMMTVKLFARGGHEDNYAIDILKTHTASMTRMTAKMFTMSNWLDVLNALFLGGTTALAIWLWAQGAITAGAVAMALPLVWQINNMSSWIMHQVTSIFENLGRVQEGIETIAKPIAITDATAAKPLVVSNGEVVFDKVSFHYGRTAESGRTIMENLSFTIKPGEKVGIVGRSGAGKSTLVNLLLRFYDVESGAIRIDGQNIAHVTQDSLRSHIGMVTQDTSLLHRSLRDNIRYGKPEATEAEILHAAELAQAHLFIPHMADFKGRTGLDAHVGERGVKLSGGQRQRVAIARVILKNAPILILDEATSALDSESEHAIQTALEKAMHGKTVIAIAHRLSTLQVMDRIVVMDAGKIVEDGNHAALLKRGGIYSNLWNMQSGGFLQED